jgi:predicted RecB family nuclease
MVLKASDTERISTTYVGSSERDYITAQTIYHYCKFPFMVYCQKFAPEEKKDPLTEYQKMIFEQSEIHRQCVIEEKYPSPERRGYTSQENGYKILLEGMNEGVDVLCDLPVVYVPEKLKGVFDILERADTSPSTFGDYHYVVKSIVSAQKISDHHIVQGAFYNYLLGKIQGYPPQVFYLINRDHEEIPKKYKEEEIVEILNSIQDVFNEKRDVSPVYDYGEWPWKTYNNEKAIELNDVSLVTGIGKSAKDKLYKNGIRTVDDLARVDKKKLKSIITVKKKEKGEMETTKSKKREEQILDKSESITSGKRLNLAPFDFPDKELEIFLDFEYIKDQLYFNTIVNIDYLIGAITKKDGEIEYKPFLADQLDKGGEIFYEFTEWILENKDFVIYHFYHPERTHLEKLAERYGLSKESEERIKENMIDIHHVFTNSFVFPTYKNGLKDIANYIGYTWKHPDVDGTECTALYFQYIENPDKNKDKLQKILDYNEDDCRALMKVKEWMQKHAS